MKLYEFVIIFGCFMLILAQIPSFHSLRHINLVSLVLCLLYSACAAAGSIYIGICKNKLHTPLLLTNLHLYASLVMYKMNYFYLNFINIITTIGNSSKGPEKNYSLKGDTEDRLFGIFNALSIIATTYGNGIIPEIQVWMSLSSNIYASVEPTEHYYLCSNTN